jgi:cobalt-zinc-cadmium resistance protein CzcA
LTVGTYQAKAKAISYQQQKAETTATFQKEQLTTQLENTLEQYQQDNRQYEYYLQKALPNAKEIMKAAQLGYKTGDIDYVAYLYALQTSTDIELKYLQAIQQLNQSVITINYLINR